jgi:hypothetical protein
MANRGRFSEEDRAALQAANEAIGGVLIPQVPRKPRRKEAGPVTVLIPKPAPMTNKEWLLLRVLSAVPRSPAELAAEGSLPADSSLPGIHQTAASCVRKSWAKRHPARGRGGCVRYTITAAGRTALEDRARKGARDAAAFTRASVRQHRRVTQCPACASPPRSERHTCGLSRLQDMLRLPGPLSPRRPR